MRKILLSLLLVIPCLVNAAVFAKAGTAGFQFLKIGVDARAIGMGEAYTAVANDISSTYWNPAGLDLSEKNQVMFSHTNWPADIQHEFFAASYRMESIGTFGFSASVLHMGEMDETTEETFGPTGRKFNAGDYSLALTYSNAYTDKFSFGFSGKYLREELAEYHVEAFAFDLGTLYNTKFHNLTLGMAMRNFGPDFKYKVDNDNDGQKDEDPFDTIDNDGDGLIDEDREEGEFKIPMHFSLGVSGDIYRTEEMNIIGSIQLDNYVDRKETWNTGVECNYGILSLRGGYMINGTDVAGSYTCGFGVKVPTSFAIFSVDYAYTDMEDLEESFSESAHRISIKMQY